MNVSTSRITTDMRSALCSLDKESLINMVMGVINNGASQKPHNEITLGGFIKEFLTYSKSQHAAKYHQSIELTLKHLSNHFGDEKPLSELTTRDFQTFFITLQQHAPKGTHVYYRNLKAIFNTAVDWEYITVNPIVKIKLPKQQKKTPQYLNLDQLNKLLRHINSRTLYILMLFAFYTGCRLGEITNLTWSAINFETGIVTIGGSEFITKTRESRQIPLYKQLLELLEELKAKDIHNKYVFCKDNGLKYNDDYVSKSFKKAVRKAGLDEELHFHSLRHSFASNLAIRGNNIYNIKSLLGHSSIKTTEIYSHLSIDSLKETINTFEGITV